MTLPNGGGRIDEAAVLALARRLVDALDEIDLDVVDGEFYWRLCRADLSPVVEAVRKFGPPPRVEDLATLAGRLRSDESERLRAEAGKQVPLPVLDALVSGNRVAMRMPEVVLTESLVPGGGTARWASVLVYSGAWTGSDVERSVLLADSWDGHRKHPGLGEGWISVQLDFAFFEDEARLAKHFRSIAPMRVPCVAVQVVSPLPPPGAIAREYDAVVREQLQWHRRLPGAGSRQEKLAAVRTWAVALLMRAGNSHLRAMAKVGQLLDPDDPREVSQVQFSEDRKVLIRRVPEAEAYLRVRPARSGK